MIRVCGDWLTEVFSDQRRWIVLAALFAWAWVAFTGSIALYRTHRRWQDAFLAPLKEGAIQLYLKQWRPKLKQNERTRDELARHIERTVPWRWFVSIVFVVLSGSTFAVLTDYALDYAKAKGRSDPPHWLPATAAAALAGGLMWVVTDQLTRLRSRDYTQDDLGTHCLRLLVAIPLGAALSAFGNPAVAPSVAFLLGAFPTTTLLTMGRRAVDRNLKLGDIADNEHHLDLQRLQGVGRPEAERFAEEGIRSLLQLAYTDPFLMTVRTNYDFDYVTDLISQALLWTYVRDKGVEGLQTLGVRGAIEAKHLKEQLARNDAGATEILNEAATRLAIPASALRNILVEVVEDPYAEFICALWDLPEGA